MSICPYCNTIFEEHSSNQIYCSRLHRIQFNNKKYRERHRDKSNSYWREYNSKVIIPLKRNSFELLGNKCMRCGTRDQDVFNIDHIQPLAKNGNKRGNDNNIIYLCRKILKLGKEAKNQYQILCRNCNWKKMLENGEREKYCNLQL